MGTKIKQEQVEGLVDAVASLEGVSGNLSTTGATLAFNLLTTGLDLESALIASGNALDSVDTALTADVTSNANRIVATGNSLDYDISIVSGNILTTGQSLRNEIFETGVAAVQDVEALADNLIITGYSIDQLAGSGKETGYSVPQLREDVDYTSGLATGVSGNLTITGENLSGNLIATGAYNASRLGVNSKVAANLGTGLPFDDLLYGETVMVPNYSGYTRVIQFMQDVFPGIDNQELYLGGVTGERATMPKNSQWHVKIYASARSVEPDDWDRDATGIYGLETGFLISHYSEPLECIKSPVLGGVSGASGLFDDLITMDFPAGYDPDDASVGQLRAYANNQYTGWVRFHATAYISQITGLQFAPA